MTDLILEKMPVTISLGLWATLITYLVSIPLGIRKAVRHGSSFDVWSSTAIVIGYAMPAFLFAMFLIVVFAGGTSLNWFPVRGLVSENFATPCMIGVIGNASPNASFRVSHSAANMIYCEAGKGFCFSLDKIKRARELIGDQSWSDTISPAIPTSTSASRRLR